MPAGPDNPDIDTARIARVYAALVGSPWANAAEREAIAKDAHPGTLAARERMLNARQYHADAAARAVTRGIRGVVFGACGVPAEPEPHTAAAAARPDARFAFADADPIVAKICEVLLDGPGRVAVCVASLRDPEGLLSRPEVAGLPRPLHVQAQMAMHFWSPDLARELLRDYARLLPATSELLLTWTLQSDTDGGRKLAETAARICGAPVYRHPAQDVKRWLTDAGFQVPSRGPADVRGRVPEWAEYERGQAPGRVMGITARLP